MASRLSIDTTSLNSVVAYQILEEHSISLKQYKIQSVIQEELTVHFNMFASSVMPDLKFVFTGSAAEGLGDLYLINGMDADMDMLGFSQLFKAVEQISHIEDNVPLFQFFIELDESNPGFGKLVLLTEEDLPLDNIGFIPMFRCENGKLYFSSSEFKINTKTEFLKLVVRNDITLPNIFDFLQIIGPAMTCHMRDLNFGLSNGFAMKNMDVVFGIPFSSWPSVASEWIHRVRHQGWPTNELIESISHKGCLMVPKENIGSPTGSLEWAFSFSHVEPVLVQSMHDVMFKTYAILKLLKKSIFEIEFGDVVSSYIIKTSVFWEAEELDNNFMTPQHLLQCVRKCLKRIRSWFDLNFAPHYFIRSHNIIRIRVDTDLRARIMTSLENTSETIHFLFRKIPPFSDAFMNRSANEIINAFVEDGLNEDGSELIAPLLENLIKQMMQLVGLTAVGGVLGTSINRNTGFCMKSLQTLQNTILDLYEHNSSSSAYTVTVSVLAVKHLFLYFLLHNSLPMGRNKEIYGKKLMLCRLRNLCAKTQPMIVLGNLLQLMFVHIALNDKGGFQKWIYKILKCLLSFSIVRCNLSDVKSLAREVSNLMFTRIYSDIFMQEITGTRNVLFVVDTIHLTEPELLFLPTILKLELECRFHADVDRQPSFRFPNEFVLSIDSEALFYYMSFSYYHIRDRNIEKNFFLQRLKALCTHSSTSWKHLAWNLLGYCYSQMGLLQEAFSAYFASVGFQDRNPDIRALSKATPVHVAFLLNKCIRSHQTE